MLMTLLNDVYCKELDLVAELQMWKGIVRECVEEGSFPELNLKKLNRRSIILALAIEDGHQGRAASRLGITPAALLGRMKRDGIISERNGNTKKTKCSACGERS